MAGILVVVTHLLGAGHLTRAAAIARACARNGDRVTLVSGGRPVPLIGLAGAELVQLPPVQGRADDLATLRTTDGAPASEVHLLDRRARLLEVLKTTRPDVVVTELFPFGRRALAAEFEALIAAAEAMRPRPALVCSVRDILVAPARAAKVAQTHALLRQHYDAVLVHADPDLVALEASWPVDAALVGRLAYTGYVDAEEHRPAAHPKAGGNGVVVSGGSSAASLPLYDAALAAAARLPSLAFRLCVGHGVDETDMARLIDTSGPNVVVERARPDFRALLRDAALLVSQAGYNTVTDILASGVRAVLVPFERGQETEQRLRAERLAARGLASLLQEDALDGESLAAAIAAAQLAPPRADRRPDMGGAPRSAAMIHDFATRSAGSRPLPERASA